MKILFSNLGYAKGIDGSLRHNVLHAGRHIYSSPAVQRQVLGQFRRIIDTESPDICCLVEIDRGSFHSAYLNQIQVLLGDDYPFSDIADKYGEQSRFSSLPFHQGKSNGFIARGEFPFERHYFRHGTKRLIYQVALPEGITLFFAHFSLQRQVRARQFQEMHRLIMEKEGRVIILADFNILHGFQELTPLLDNTDLRLLNRQDEPTFTFHRRRLVLDLCLCSAELAERMTLRVIPQPFSDHAALLVEW